MPEKPPSFSQEHFIAQKELAVIIGLICVDVSVMSQSMYHNRIPASTHILVCGRVDLVSGAVHHLH